VRSYRPLEYETDDGPWGPMSGGASALLGTIGSLIGGVSDVPVDFYKRLGQLGKKKDTSASGGAGSKETEDQPVVGSQRRAGARDSNMQAEMAAPMQAKGSEPKVPTVTSGEPTAMAAPQARENLPPVTLESTLDAGKGLGRIVGAGIRSPMDFTLALAKGFHNAPKLYGDDTVRESQRITGLSSGLKAAGTV